MRETFSIYVNRMEFVKNMINVLNQGQKILKQLNKKYWIAQWSWQPICDGIYPSETTITNFYTLDDGTFVYFSKYNNRKYFGFQLCETEEEAEKVSDLLNSFSYDSIIAINEMTYSEKYAEMHKTV